ncbi:holin [Streptomyces sp. N35]
MNATKHWAAVLERALKAFVQALLAVLGAGSFGLRPHLHSRCRVQA